MRWKELACIVIIILLAVSVSNYVIQRNEIKEIQAKYDELNKTLQNVLNQNTRLTTEKEQLQNQSEELKAKINILEKDISAATKLIDFYTATINESIQWFRNNNNIKDVEEIGFIPAQLKTHCVLMDANCKIKLGCLPFVNGYKNDIEYQPDIEAVGREDYLKNLSLILQSKGGDCEDISLLFVAEYNYLVDYCLKEGYSRDQIKLYSYVPHPSLKYHVSYDKTSDIEYFIPNAETIEVSKGDNYIYIICGTFAGQEFGHCVVAVTDSEIKQSKDVFSKLNSAPLIEPQNGMLIGYVNDPAVISLYDNGQKPFNTYLIYVVILDDDMLLFNWKYEDKFLYNWVGYHDFNDILFVLKYMLEK